MKSSKLYVTQRGKGPAVLFLHGFLESTRMWAYLDLEKLESHCVFIDLPGHGNSPLLNELPPSIERMAEKVLEVVNELNLQSYSIVGHSMGGYVGLQLIQKDKRAKRLVLLNSNFWSDPEEKKIDRRRVADLVYKAKEFFLREAIPNLFLDPEKCQTEVNKLIEEAKRIEPDAIAYASLAMAERPDLSQFVSNNKERIFVLQGAEDRIVMRNRMEASVTLNENYFIIENSGHMSHIEQPDVVLKNIKACLME
jgi:pimeloyl-ACP methyl ester carboxylesterase